MRSVVMFSGGLDSFATLALAREAGEVAALVHFCYGQRHQHAENVAVQRLSGTSPVHYLDVGGLSQLNKDGDIYPGRNPVFLTLAAALAKQVDATEVWSGFCGTDNEGFPDCRPAFLEAQQSALHLALDFPQLRLVAPLQGMTKMDTLNVLMMRGLLDEAIEHTHTCYEGDHHTRHSWGYGCGECSACKMRAVL